MTSDEFERHLDMVRGTSAVWGERLGLLRLRLVYGPAYDRATADDWRRVTHALYVQGAPESADYWWSAISERLVSA